MFVWLEVQSSVKKLIVEPKFQLKVYVRMLLCLVSSQSASQSVDANGSKTDLYFLYYSHEILSSPLPHWQSVGRYKTRLDCWVI